VLSWLVNEYMLVPLGIEYLRTIAFILVIAVVVQFTETVMHKTSPVLYQVLGIFLPLITTNCAVLGVALLNLQEQRGFLESRCTASAPPSASRWCWCCSPPCASASPWPTCPSLSRAGPSRWSPPG
jgi:electron transport complex protein RnfA